MARTAGAAGMLDIRSAAIFEDFVYASNACLPGSTETKIRRYYGSALFQDLPLDADQRNPKNYDRVKDWTAAFCSFAICLTIFGIIHSVALTHPRNVLKFGMGFVEICLVASATYAIVMLFGPFAALLVRSIGHQVTCIFGMLLFFVGLVLDALEIAQPVYYVAHILLMGLGACLTITAATSAVVDHFRQHLPYALAFLSCASPVGTAFFVVLTYFLTVYEPIQYRTRVIIFALIVLILIAATHALPSSIRVVKHPNPFYKKQTKGKGIQECVGEATLAEQEARRCDPYYDLPGPQDQKPCLCVCVCDVSILTDLSFLLWAGISSCAMLTLYVPYLLVVAYAAEDRGIEYWDAIWLIIWYSVGSLITRLCIMLGKDHTLVYNRSAFQIAIIGSGVLYYFLTMASTYGWLLCWCLVMGAIEGILITSIPRVTMQTIPRKHMICSWSYIVVFHGFAIIIGPYLFASARVSDTQSLYIACLAVGLAQIIAGFLAFLLPDEQEGEPIDEEPAELSVANLGFSSAGAGLSSYSTGSGAYQLPAPAMESDSFVSTYKSRSISYKGSIGRANRANNCCMHGTHDYITNCPICSEIGCIPGCSPCTPGGLADGSIPPMFGSAQPLNSLEHSDPTTDQLPASKDQTPGPGAGGMVKSTEFEVRLTKGKG